MKDLLIRHLGAAKVYGGGLEVTTSIDLGLQKLAQNAVKRELPDPLGPAAALVAIDPRNGEVLAMVGGRSYKHSQFNLATQAQRQAGSSFKPFVLAAALEEGISPDSTLVSKPLYLYLGNRYWSVSNSEDSYLGRIDLRTATTFSDNTVFAQLTQIVNPKAVVAAAHGLGIQSPLDPYLSIGLGTDLVNPLEMARAYARWPTTACAWTGAVVRANEPRAVLGYRDLQNATRISPQQRRRHAEDASNDAAIITSMLENVISSGTGKRAALPDRVAAGKTGTTENYGDAWFVGYTPQLVVGGLGRLPEQARADGAPLPRPAGCRRYLPGPDLEVVHGVRLPLPREERIRAGAGGPSSSRILPTPTRSPSRSSGARP